MEKLSSFRKRGKEATSLFYTVIKAYVAVKNRSLFIELEVRKTKTEEPAPSVNLSSHGGGQKGKIVPVHPCITEYWEGEGHESSSYQDSSPTIGRNPLVKAEPSGSNHFLKVPPLCTLELGLMFIRYKLWEIPLNHSTGSF